MPLFHVASAEVTQNLEVHSFIYLAVNTDCRLGSQLGNQPEHLHVTSLCDLGFHIMG